MKLWLSILWLIITFSLVTWWWLYALQSMQPVGSDSHHKMFFWEGSFLLIVIFMGGMSLIVYSYTEYKRHSRLKHFFALFSHDLKTSITRLRLQSDVLKEKEYKNNPTIEQLTKDISRLDLQLENSLWMATLEEDKFPLSPSKLSKLIEYIRYDFENLEIELKKDANIQVQPKAFESVLRNIFQNALIHGKATRMVVSTEEKPHFIEIRFFDNGQGFEGSTEKLGHSSLLSNENRKTNGIGLYLCGQLIKKMHGTMSFNNHPQGFEVCLKFKT